MTKKNVDLSEKIDIFLCFSENDNLPIGKGQRGWVSSLHRFLSTLLNQILSQEVTLHLISEKNVREVNFQKATIVIGVITKDLVQHTEMVKKLNQYGKEKEHNKELTIGGVSSFIKVFKTPFESDALFPVYSSLISHDFYIIDTLSGEYQEITKFFGEQTGRIFWMKLVDLAYSINQYLHNKNRDNLEVQNQLREKTVYLASTGVDIVIQRDIIKRELVRHGYRVLPNHTLPKENHILQNMIKKDLKECCLSIHLVGEDYGYKPHGSDFSVVDIQNTLAAEHTQLVKKQKSNLKGKSFSRMIWVSPDLKNITERQKIFIEKLKSDAAELDEAEVLQINLQVLKSILLEELQTGGRFKNRNARLQNQNLKNKKNNKKIIVYLIYDKKDIEKCIELKDFLIKKGYEVLYPTYQGDVVDLRIVHQENLRKCDASLIYYGQSTHQWIKTKLQDLLKAPGFGRSKPFLAKAVLVEKDKTDVDMNEFKRNRAMVIQQNGKFDPKKLDSFIQKLAKQ